MGGGIGGTCAVDINNLLKGEWSRISIWIGCLMKGCLPEGLLPRGGAAVREELNDLKEWGR